MRLKNKKTGEIGNLEYRGLEDERIWVWTDNISKPEYRYNSLTELNEEWEDYDDTKDPWCISFCGEAKQIGSYADREEIADCKEIGNYFETKEEAEKAVEKLKAWKRLKDKGFIFCGTEFGERPLTQPEAEESEQDLAFLFGGEE